MSALPPWTNVMQLDASSTLHAHRYADRFSAVRVETTGPLAAAVEKTSSVPALLVSVFTRSTCAASYELRVLDKIVPTGTIRAFRSNVIDLDMHPSTWAARSFETIHFHVRRSAIEITARDLGYERVGEFRLSVADDDIVLAQIAKSILPNLDARISPLALDQLELIVAAHLVSRYGARRPRPAAKSGLASWQRRHVTEILRDNLEGRIRLATLADACDLSVSHFARAFKASFGVTCHRWLTEKRIARAKELLAHSDAPLADVASQSGFGDQASFTRTFHRFVGAPPGHWRRENAARIVKRRQPASRA